MTNLAEAMLAVSEAPAVKNRLRTAGTTVEVQGDKATVEFPRKDGEDADSAAYRYLVSKGENPDDWEVTGFRSTEWTMPNGEIGESMRYTFARRSPAQSDGGLADVEETLAWLEQSRRPPRRARRVGLGEPVAPLFAVGDTQFGKADGDGVDGTLARFVDYTDEFVDRLIPFVETHNVSEVGLFFMGDHGEGLVSQGGANIWRTSLTATEQFRLTARAMSYVIEQTAHALPLGVAVHAAAVPGNHGEPIRISGKGVMKYSDSWDTEALVSVADGLRLASDPALRRVKTYVPTGDEMAVVLDLADTRTGLVHGHQHRPGKHFEWLEGQVLDKRNPLRDIDLLLEGHLHHFYVDTRNGVTMVGVPAVESESTWFRHRTGISGDPGAVFAVVGGGRVLRLEVIR